MKVYSEWRAELRPPINGITAVWAETIPQLLSRLARYHGIVVGRTNKNIRAAVRMFGSTTYGPTRITRMHWTKDAEGFITYTTAKGVPLRPQPFGLSI